MKIGRVTSVVSDLQGEQTELHKKSTEKEKENLKKERIAQKKSMYRHDPIGWCDSELED